jgi:hypothetical protein
MVHLQSEETESRRVRLLELIRSGGCASPALANRLNVSTPTVSRWIFALRRRSRRITAVRDGSR